MTSALHDGLDVPAATADSLPVSVLGKAHLLLAAFSAGATCLGLSELSRRSGVPKATVHRLSAELVELGYLTRTTSGYQLGWRIYELGQLVPGPANLCAVARPILIDLRSMTRAAVVHLAVTQGDDCLLLERIGGRREVAVLSAVAARAPIMATASGRMLLSHNSPSDQTLAMLQSHKAHRPVGVAEVARLRAEMNQIRDRRWAAEWGECAPGMKTFSVPIDHGESRPVAALSATVPVQRRDDQRVVHALWSAAIDVSRGLKRASAMAPGDNAGAHTMRR